MDYQATSETEIYSSTDHEFKYSFPLPTPRHYHSVATVDENRVILSGDYHSTTEVFMFDLTTHLWSNMPEQPVTLTRQVSGLAKNREGSMEFVIAGGHSTKWTYIFSFDNGNWTQG